jgi:DivIVA domain-containing protein
MIDPAGIRNASFTLTPTGYNPEEVDRFLAQLADELESAPVAAAPVAAAPVATVENVTVESPAPAEAVHPADLSSLGTAIDRTIGALESFVQTELAAVRAASELEVDDIHRERERLMNEAADAARAHLDEARARAEQVAADMRAEAERQASGIVEVAEDRRRQADEMVAAAARVQAQVLDSLESARSTLAPAAPSVTESHDEPEAEAEVRTIFVPESHGDDEVESETSAGDEPNRVDDATDAAA